MSPLGFCRSIFRECLGRTEMESYLSQLDVLEDAFIIELLVKLEECRRCQWAKALLVAHPDSCASICLEANEAVRN